MGMHTKDLNKVIFEIPSLLRCKDIRERYERICMIFDMYYGIKAEEVRKILLSFPYLPFIDDEKLTVLLGLFKRYRFTQ